LASDPIPLDHRQRLRIGAFTADFGALSITGPDGGSVRLTPKAAAVLLELARAPGTTVTRDELLERIWRGRFTTPGVVPQAISALRRAFADELETPAYIDTIPRVGYRLIASVQPLAPEPADEGAEAGGEAPPAPGHAPPASRWARPLAVIGALGAVALLGAFAIERVAEAPPPPLLAGPATLATFAPGAESQPRLSPDGRRLAYVQAETAGAPRQVFVLGLADSATRAVTDPAVDASQPVFSPDGTELAYRSVGADGRCELKIVAIDGGLERTIGTCDTDDLIAFDWDPIDPRRMLGSSLERGRIGGGALRTLRLTDRWHDEALAYGRDDAAIDLEPRFSPDGTLVAFRRGPNPTSDLWVMPAAGGEPRRLTRVRARFSGFDWWPDGRHLVFASDHGGREELWRVAIDDGRVERLGIADAVFPDVAGDTLVYQGLQWRTALVALDLGAPGAAPSTPGAAQARVLTASSGRDLVAAASPDGQRLAFVSDRDGTRELWLREADGTLRRLTAHRGPVLDRPSWSPDGERLLYIVRDADRHAVWEYRLASGGAVQVAGPMPSLREAIYARDGRSLWLVALQERDWALLACTRGEAPGCAPTPTSRSAFRIERLGPDALLIATSAGELQRVAEDAPGTALERFELPINDGWSLQGGRLWLLRNDGTPRLEAWVPGAEAPEASWALDGVQPLLYARPERSPDGRTVWLPAVLEYRSDIVRVPLAPP
jgi:DNA-binding winged helix-turn-helix (wHTH) protein